MDWIWQGFQLFHKGGFVMYLLLACSLFVVYSGAERWLYYKEADSGRSFAARFYTLMKTKQYEKAKEFSRHSKGGLAQILEEAMNQKETVQINGFVEVQSGILLAKLRSRLYYLNSIVTMAPLLGLLGTISGMITSFSIFNMESGQAAAITGGVGEALIATAFGLCVAILSLVIHAYFIQRLDHIITDMEMCFSALELHSADIQGR